MKKHNFQKSRRNFLKAASMTSAAMLLLPRDSFPHAEALAPQRDESSGAPADYTLHIKSAPVEIASNKIISLTTYNGQFPGPLLRFKEGQQAVIDVFNETDVPEQLHWHGQMVPVEVDGAAEEGTTFIPAHGSAASYSRQSPRASVSITPTTAAAQISLPGNTVVRSARCTSSQNTSRATMIARSFSS